MKRGRKKISIRSTRMTWTYAPWNFSKKRWKGAFNVSSPFLLHFCTLRVSSKVSVINVHSHLWFCFILFPLLQLFTCQRLTFTIEESSLIGVLNRANINFTICVGKKVIQENFNVSYVHDHFIVARIFFVAYCINIQKSLYRLFHVYYFLTLPDRKSKGV